MLLQVKIIAVPSGKAPYWVRDKWLGLYLPLAQNVPNNMLVVNVLGEVVGNQSGYLVETEKTLQRLKGKNQEAAQWWKDHIDPIVIRWLLFHEDVCELH